MTGKRRPGHGVEQANFTARRARVAAQQQLDRAERERESAMQRANGKLRSAMDIPASALVPPPCDSCGKPVEDGRLLCEGCR